MNRTKAKKAAAKRTRTKEVVTDVLDIGGGFTVDVVETVPAPKRKREKEAEKVLAQMAVGVKEKLKAFKSKGKSKKDKVAGLWLNLLLQAREKGRKLAAKVAEAAEHYGVEPGAIPSLEKAVKRFKLVIEDLTPLVIHQATAICTDYSQQVQKRLKDYNSQFAPDLTNPQEFADKAKQQDLAKSRRAREARKAGRPVPAGRQDQASTPKERPAKKVRATASAKGRNGGAGGDGADAWGYRSWRMLVNAAITDKGKSKEDLHKESGISMERLNKYLPRLVAQGLVVEAKNKYTRK